MKITTRRIKTALATYLVGVVYCILTNVNTYDLFFDFSNSDTVTTLRSNSHICVQETLFDQNDDWSQQACLVPSGISQP